uniref:Uncharacterized protein n=1 Tax=Oryza punctata TaxID=4537 RepID=A0A0E0LC60_ORYPU
MEVAVAMAHPGAPSTTMAGAARGGAAGVPRPEASSRHEEVVMASYAAATSLTVGGMQGSFLGVGVGSCSTGG